MASDGRTLSMRTLRVVLHVTYESSVDHHRVASHTDSLRASSCGWFSQGSDFGNSPRDCTTRTIDNAVRSSYDRCGLAPPEGGDGP
jgi:hypothetical protein